MPLFPDAVPQKTSLRTKFKDWTVRFCRVFFYGLGIITFLGICLDVIEAARMNSPASFPEQTGLRLDLDTVVEATNIINPILDDLDLIEESYILDVSSKERDDQDE